MPVVTRASGICAAYMERMEVREELVHEFPKLLLVQYAIVDQDELAQVDRLALQQRIAILDASRQRRWLCAEMADLRGRDNIARRA